MSILSNLLFYLVGMWLHKLIFILDFTDHYWCIAFLYHAAKVQNYPSISFVVLVDFYITCITLALQRACD